MTISPVKESILEHLSDADMLNLARTSKELQKLLKPDLERYWKDRGGILADSLNGHLQDLNLGNNPEELAEAAQYQEAHETILASLLSLEKAGVLDDATVKSLSEAKTLFKKRYGQDPDMQKSKKNIWDYVWDKSLSSKGKKAWIGSMSKKFWHPYSKAFFPAIITYDSRTEKFLTYYNRKDATDLTEQRASFFAEDFLERLPLDVKALMYIPSLSEDPINKAFTQAVQKISGATLGSDDQYTHYAGSGRSFYLLEKQA